MLTRYEADLVRADPSLPALGTLLDPECFADALRDQGLALEHAEPAQLRYRPGDRCSAEYTLIGLDGQRQPAYAVASKRSAGSTGSRSETNPSHAPTFQLPDGISVCLFPRDLRLRALETLLDPTARPRLLARLLPERPDLQDATLETLRYKCERRYVCRVGSERPVAVKLYTRRHFAAASRQAAWIRSDAEVRVPAVLGTSEKHRALALEWAPGRLVRDDLHATHTDLEAVARGAEAVASLHASRIPELPRRDRREEIRRLDAVLNVLRTLRPDLEERVHRTRESLLRRLGETPETTTPIHGDFYDKQILLDGGRVTLIDFDEAAQGDPLCDVGLFVAHLERDSLLGRLPGERARAARDRFLDAYASARGRDPRGAVAHVAIALLRLSTYPFRIRHPAWPEEVERILDRTTQILEA